jgi:hypothetical protein
MADPVRAERQREQWRFYNEKRAREKGVAKWCSRSKWSRSVTLVDPAPFLGWIDDYLARFPSESLPFLAERAGSHSRTVRNLRDGSIVRIGVDVVDRFLTAADEPWVLDELYPLEDCVAA